MDFTPMVQQLVHCCFGNSPLRCQGGQSFGKRLSDHPFFGTQNFCECGIRKGLGPPLRPLSWEQRKAAASPCSMLGLCEGDVVLRMVRQVLHEDRSVMLEEVLIAGRHLWMQDLIGRQTTHFHPPLKPPFFRLVNLKTPQMLLALPSKAKKHPGPSQCLSGHAQPDL